MSISQKTTSKPLVDFIPAQLHENKTWVVEYYVLNPFTQKLERKKLRVKPIKSITERRKLGKRMVFELNKRLEEGWNPFLENNSTKSLTKLTVALKLWFNQIMHEYESGNMRFDTKRTYDSHLKNFLLYLKTTNNEDMFCYKLDRRFVDDFLDYRRYDLNNSARTRDNYLNSLNTIGKWLEKKKYISSNPCEDINKINKSKTTKELISNTDREKIFNYFKKHNPNYLIFCMVCYYCLVRRTELSKIRVKDVNINESTLFVEATDSKNNKTAYVTIPRELNAALRKHIAKAKQNDYVFSKNNYACGSVQFRPNDSTDYWAKMRKEINIPDHVKWYNLKDTGITDLIISGVDLRSVRDQARHHSITQTDAYVPRNMRKADDNILNSGIVF